MKAVDKKPVKENNVQYNVLTKVFLWSYFIVIVNWINIFPMQAQYG